MDAFAEILEAARAGADWAWRRIYDDLAPALLGYLTAQGAPDPDDLTGEVFVHVVRDVGRFDGDERAFRAWVFVIAHHRLIDDRRRRARRPEHIVEPDVLASQRDPSEVSEIVAERLSAERVRALIDGLVPEQRTVLLLRILGGLTVDEVARALGKRPGAVKALQRRGLAALRRRIESSS